MKHGYAVHGHRDAAEQHHEKFKKMIGEEVLFLSRCLIAMKLASSGRECHVEHISRRRRPPCLAISR